MKTLIKLTIATVCMAALSAQAEWVNGHHRSATYVSGYYRTPRNNTPYDNLSYKGYPSQQPGYSTLRSGYNVVPSFNSYAPKPNYRVRTLPCTGRVQPTPLYRTYR